MSRKELLDELSKMSATQRILLAQELWDSAREQEREISLSSAMKRELDRRLKAVRARKIAGTSWSEVKKRIRKST